MPIPNEAAYKDKESLEPSATEVQDAQDELVEKNFFAATKKIIQPNTNEQNTREEKEKLRKQEKELELEHRQIIHEKYKPSVHSSLNRNKIEMREFEVRPENFMDMYSRKIQQKNKQVKQSVHF